VGDIPRVGNSTTLAGNGCGRVFKFGSTGLIDRRFDKVTMHGISGLQLRDATCMCNSSRGKGVLAMQLPLFAHILVSEFAYEKLLEAGCSWMTSRCNFLDKKSLNLNTNRLLATTLLMRIIYRCVPTTGQFRGTICNKHSCLISSSPIFPRRHALA
jgi:hypothetical protein